MVMCLLFVLKLRHSIGAAFLLCFLILPLEEGVPVGGGSSLFLQPGWVRLGK